MATATVTKCNFNPNAFLPSIDTGRKGLKFAKKQNIFRHGDACDSVFYAQKRQIKLSVLSKVRKEASLGILSTGLFFGESCLTGATVRLSSATAMTDFTVMRIEKQSMVDVLHREHTLSDMFVAYLVTRNIRYEEDLVDQLFNSSEKRLPAFSSFLRNSEKMVSLKLQSLELHIKR